MTQTQFPAIDQLREHLRAELISARPRPRRRRRLLVVAVAALLATPASLAVAGVFDSAKVDYECPQAQDHAPGAVAGAPVDGPGQPAQVEPEPAHPAPKDPC